MLKMTMLKQSPSKSLRSKGFKPKNVLQICVLLAICIWLLHQVKHTYDENSSYQEGTAKVSLLNGEYGSAILGRKYLHSQIQRTNSKMNTHAEKVEFEMGDNKNDEKIGVVDDEMENVHDEEKVEEEEPEEIEDLIDEEDREKEDESEEQDREEMENQVEDGIAFENEAHFEGGRKSQDAANSVVEEEHSISNESLVGGLRKLMEKLAKSEKTIQLGMGKGNKHPNLSI